MKIKCGGCGKNILVPDDLVVGQHVRCPYCEEKTSFDKPSRVPLPEGFEIKHRARARIDEMKRARAERTGSQPAVADLPEVHKPKLAIRRPVQESKDREHMNAAAAAVHARVRRAERKKFIADIKKTLGNLISIITLFALVVVGYVVWMTVQKKEMPVQLPGQVTTIFSNVVEKVNAEVAK